MKCEAGPLEVVRLTRIGVGRGLSEVTLPVHLEQAGITKARVLEEYRRVSGV